MTDTAEKMREKAEAIRDAKKAKALKTWQSEAAQRKKQLDNLEDRARRLVDRKYDDLVTYQERCELLLEGSDALVEGLKADLDKERDPSRKAAIQVKLDKAIAQQSDDAKELTKATGERQIRQRQIDENKSLQATMKEWMATRRAELERESKISDETLRTANEAAEKEYQNAIKNTGSLESKTEARRSPDPEGGELLAAKRQEHAELVKEHERLWSERSAAFTRLIAATNRLSEPTTDPEQREQVYKTYTAANDAHEAIAAQCNEHSKKLAGFIWT